MNRRCALAQLTAGAVAAAAPARAAEPPPRHDLILPSAIDLVLDKPLTINAASVPVKHGDDELSIIKIGQGTFHLDESSRLTAKLHAAVAQYADVDYWISVAVFDAGAQLLGTARHKQAVGYIRLGAMPTMLPEIALDFGISNAYRRAAQVAVAISERDVPPPG